MDRNNHESNPGMIERQLDESPMEGRSSSDMELDRDHLQRTDRPVEREGMQGGSVERDSMRVVRRGPGGEHRETVGPPPVPVSDHLHRDLLGPREVGEEGFERVGRIAGDDKESARPAGPGAAHDMVDQRASGDVGERLRGGARPQPAPLAGGDDEALHKRARLDAAGRGIKADARPCCCNRLPARCKSAAGKG